MSNLTNNLLASSNPYFDRMAEVKPLFLVVLNGSFMFAAALLKEITFPCEISFIKLASYHGTQSSGEVNELIGLSEDIKNRNVVIIEDVITSGGQVILSAEDIRKAGANILCTICVINRQQGGTEALEQAGIPLISLFTMEELKAAK